MNKETKYLLKSGLSNLLAGWTRRYAVYAPQMGERSIDFAPLAPVDQLDQLAQRGQRDTLDKVVLRSPSSKWPPKRFFFPQSESLLKYNLAAHGRERVTPVVPEDQPVLLYGVRPCDAHAFEILDHVFLKQQDVADPYYGARRARTTVVAVACDAPARTCFCGSLEGDPHGTEGCDLLLRDADEGYVIEVLTDKGRAALESAVLEKATTQQTAAVEERQAKAAKMARIEAQPRKFVEALADIFETNVWDRIHEKCIACGTCTFLCPMCHCFDIQDEKAGKAGRRMRNWDSCMFPLFTLHASGHNPRATQRERWRQRAMHKFNYYPAKFGPIACVGCGRCVKDCPTGVDIRKILKTLEEAATASSSSSSSPSKE